MPILLFLSKMLFPLRKHLIIIKLRPIDLGTHSGKPPLPLNASIPHRRRPMCMTFHRHLGERVTGVSLMCNAQLMMSHHLLFGRLLPRAQPDQMLRFQERVSQETGVRGHKDEFVTGHRFPDLVEEGAVINLLKELGNRWGWGWGWKRPTLRVGATILRRRPQSLVS